MALRRALVQSIRTSTAVRSSLAFRPAAACPQHFVPARAFCTPKVDASKPAAKVEPAAAAPAQDAPKAEASKAEKPKAAGGGAILPEHIVHNPSVFNNLSYAGYIGYAQLAAGMLCHDVLFLRSLITGGSAVMTSFHLLQRVPLRIPLFFSALFTLINLTFAVQIFLARRVNLSEEESAIHQEFFADVMADFEFQKLIRAGTIEKPSKPTKIIQAGQPQTHLAYVLDGSVDIAIDGDTHVTVKKGEFVGENALISKPHNARADAVAAAGSKYIYWDIPKLKESLVGDAHSQRAIEVMITRELAMKLHDSSILLARENHEVHEHIGRTLSQKKTSAAMS